MTLPVRTRPPQHSRGTHRARRTRSYVVALFLVAAGAVLGWTLPRLERHLPKAGLTFDASTAQATLAAIAGGMITLAGFVITAITLVVQTVQSMSPRLVAALGNFSRYLVLFGLLIGTALYALVALSQVRGDDVPRLSVTLAVGFVLVDAVTVLSLISSLRSAVTGGGLARSVGERLRTVVDQMYPAGAQESVDGPAPAPGRRATPLVHRGRPSVVYALDEPRLTRLAARHGLRVRFRCAVGDFVRPGTTIAYVETPQGTDPGSLRHRLLIRWLTSRVHFGPSRTMEQDAAYGLRLLADIAVRSLSPAVNDPTTAVQALDQVEDVLLLLSERPLGPAWLLDKAGERRVHSRAPQWRDLLSLALDETLLYGAGNPQLVRRLHELLGRLSAATSGERRSAVEERRQALERLADAGLSDPLLRRVAAEPDAHGLGGPSAPPEAGPGAPPLRN